MALAGTLLLAACTRGDDAVEVVAAGTVTAPSTTAVPSTKGAPPTTDLPPTTVPEPTTTVTQQPTTVAEPDLTTTVPGPEPAPPVTEPTSPPAPPVALLGGLDLPEIVPDLDVAVPGGLGGRGGASALTVASDGAAWFIAGPTLGRVDPGGELRLIPLPPGVEGGFGITEGPDRAIWFTQTGTPGVGRLAADGSVTTIPLTGTSNPMGVPGQGAMPTSIITGPDGALWVTEAMGDQIDRITVDGQVTHLPLPDRERWHGSPFGLAVGGDGCIWFVEQLARRVGRVDPATLSIETVEFPPSGSGAVVIRAVAAGADGALWLAGPGQSEVTRVALDGRMSFHPIDRFLSFGQPAGIALGGDGALWIPQARGDVVLRVDVEGAVSAARVDGGGLLEAAAAGPDGAVWLLDIDGGRVVRIAV